MMITTLRRGVIDVIQCDIQRASLLKRFSAFLLDFIILTILSTLFIFLLSVITHYDFYNTQLISAYDMYEEKYGVTFSISPDEYNSYSSEERDTYDRAYEDLIYDSAAMENYEKVMNLTLFNLSLGVFLAFLLSEFVLPLIFGNGVTIGKKIFGLALMRKGGWKVNGISLFIRAILGKYTIETMVPLLILVLILFNAIGVMGPFVIIALFIFNIILIFTSYTHQGIHDRIADTVVVDWASQKIYETEGEAIEAKREEAKMKDEENEY